MFKPRQALILIHGIGEQRNLYSVWIMRFLLGKRWRPCNVLSLPQRLVALMDFPPSPRIAQMHWNLKYWAALFY